MMSTTYSLSLPRFFVCDKPSEDEHLELEAQVRSGYYFLTLSTQLDLLAEERSSQRLPVDPQLEKTIRNLDYLQEHYAITKKLRYQRPGKRR